MFVYVNKSQVLQFINKNIKFTEYDLNNKKLLTFNT